jgi:hypothetical protein
VAARVIDEEETDRHFVAKRSSKVAGNIKGIKGIYNRIPHLSNRERFSPGKGLIYNERDRAD